MPPGEYGERVPKKNTFSSWSGRLVQRAVHAGWAWLQRTGSVTAELRAALDAATAAGIEPDRVVLDPGLGFSKTPAQSLLLLDQLGALRALGRPILVGPSRKRFLGEATGREVDDRDRATAAACLLARERGARLFRVHEPAAVGDALALAAALEGTG